MLYIPHCWYPNHPQFNCFLVFASSSSFLHHFICSTPFAVYAWIALSGSGSGSGSVTRVSSLPVRVWVKVWSRFVKTRKTFLAPQRSIYVHECTTISSGCCWFLFILFLMAFLHFCCGYQNTTPTRTRSWLCGKKCLSIVESFVAQSKANQSEK